MADSIKEKVKALNEDVLSLAARRLPFRPVKIVLVTKFVDCVRMQEAYDCGARDFGENHAQELRDKRLELPQGIQWHMIGRLQTNKVKYLVGYTALIQSLDRIELAVEIEKQALKKNIAQVDCLIQVNSSDEPQKGGVACSEAPAFLGALMARFPRLRIRGLMTVGPETPDENRIRLCFRRTAELFNSLRVSYPSNMIDTLSMGMSSDYRIAIEEGATLIRVGSRVFGSRPMPQE